MFCADNDNNWSYGIVPAYSQQSPTATRCIDQFWWSVHVGIPNEMETRIHIDDSTTQISLGADLAYYFWEHGIMGHHYRLLQQD